MKPEYMSFALGLAFTVLLGRIEKNRKQISDDRIGSRDQVSGFLNTKYSIYEECRGR